MPVDDGRTDGSLKAQATTEEQDRLSQECLERAQSLHPDVDLAQLEPVAAAAAAQSLALARDERELPAVFEGELGRMLEERDVLGAADSVLPMSAEPADEPTDTPAFAAASAQEPAHAEEPFVETAAPVAAAAPVEAEAATQVAAASAQDSNVAADTSSSADLPPWDDCVEATRMRLREGRSPEEIQRDKGYDLRTYDYAVIGLMRYVDTTLPDTYAPHVDKPALMALAAGRQEIERAFLLERHIRECAECSEYFVDLLDATDKWIAPAEAANEVTAAEVAAGTVAAAADASPSLANATAAASNYKVDGGWKDEAGKTDGDSLPSSTSRRDRGESHEHVMRISAGQLARYMTDDRASRTGNDDSAEAERPATSPPASGGVFSLLRGGAPAARVGTAVGMAVLLAGASVEAGAQIGGGGSPIIGTLKHVASGKDDSSNGTRAIADTPTPNASAGGGAGAVSDGTGAGGAKSGADDAPWGGASKADDSWSDGGSGGAKAKQAGAKVDMPFAGGWEDGNAGGGDSGASLGGAGGPTTLASGGSSAARAATALSGGPSAPAALSQLASAPAAPAGSTSQGSSPTYRPAVASVPAAARQPGLDPALLASPAPVSDKPAASEEPAESKPAAATTVASQPTETPAAVSAVPAAVKKPVDSVDQLAQRLLGTPSGGDGSVTPAAAKSDTPAPEATLASASSQTPAAAATPADSADRQLQDVLGKLAGDASPPSTTDGASDPATDATEQPAVDASAPTGDAGNPDPTSQIVDGATDSGDHGLGDGPTPQDGNQGDPGQADNSGQDGSALTQQGAEDPAQPDAGQADSSEQPPDANTPDGSDQNPGGGDSAPQDPGSAPADGVGAAAVTTPAPAAPVAPAAPTTPPAAPTTPPAAPTTPPAVTVTPPAAPVTPPAPTQVVNDVSVSNGADGSTSISSAQGSVKIDASGAATISSPQGTVSTTPDGQVSTSTAGTGGGQSSNTG